MILAESPSSSICSGTVHESPSMPLTLRSLATLRTA